MAYDALVSPQGAYTTKTGTGTLNGAGVDLGAATAIRRPLWVRVRYYAASNASGSNSLVFGWEDSADNAAFDNHSEAKPIALTTTAKGGIVYVPVTGARRYGRLTADVTGGGSGASVTFAADLADSQG